MAEEKHSHKKEKKEKKEKRKSLTSESAMEVDEVAPAAAAAAPVASEENKSKKRKSSGVGAGDEDDKYDQRLSALLPFAQPLAPKKLNKKVMKTVKKAAKQKHIRRGVKEVVKSLRKGDKGLVVLAGDISPADVISHIPVLCEDSSVPYVFVPSKEDLGGAGATKRPTSCIMVVPGGFKKDGKESEYREAYDEIVSEIKGLA